MLEQFFSVHACECGSQIAFSSSLCSAFSHLMLLWLRLTCVHVCEFEQIQPRKSLPILFLFRLAKSLSVCIGEIIKFFVWIDRFGRSVWLFPHPARCHACVLKALHNIRAHSRNATELPPTSHIDLRSAKQRHNRQQSKGEASKSRRPNPCYSRCDIDDQRSCLQNFDFDFSSGAIFCHQGNIFVAIVLVKACRRVRTRRDRSKHWSDLIVFEVRKKWLGFAAKLIVVHPGQSDVLFLKVPHTDVWERTRETVGLPSTRSIINCQLTDELHVTPIARPANVSNIIVDFSIS